MLRFRAGRGLRRPLFWLALLWILVLCMLKGAGVELYKPSEAEQYLARTGGTARGILRGSLTEIHLSSSGNYSLTLEEALFLPEREEDQEAGFLAADRVLAYFPTTVDLVPGQVLEIKGSMALFREADNPGEFDARNYYRSRGMGCFMEGDALRVAQEGRNLPAAAAWRVKRFLLAGLGKVYTLGEAGLLGAMLLGERGGVEAETESLYETAGLSHLLSVSGLHVSFWAALLGRMSGALLSFFPFHRGRRFWSRRGFGLLRALLCLGTVGFYMLICGSRIPVQRAGLMALLFQMSQGLGLSFDLPSALGAAALAALIPAPEALFQASFQLSFGCVFLLGCLLPTLSRKLLMESRAGRALLVPVLVQMGMLPLTLWHYFTFRSYSFAANLLAVPLAGIVLAFGFLSALLAHIFLPLGGILAGAVHLLLEAIRRLCLLVERLPLHSLVTGRPETWQILVYLGLALGGLGLIFRIRRREVESLDLQLKLAGSSLFRRAFREARSTALLLFFWLLAAAGLFLWQEDESLRITSLYVGQGDSHVISIPEGGSYLMDVGGGYDTAGEKVILPYLQCRGIRSLEYVIISHPDRDHTLGLIPLLEGGKIGVKGLLLPAVFADSEAAAPLLAAAEKAGVPVRFLKAVDSWQAGDAVFTVLYPGAQTQVDDNESSLVLRLDWGDFSLLFTGDLGETGESMILRAYGEQLQPVTVLKAGHHGSRFSTSAAFLERLRPRLTLIACGRNNRHGHPAPETLGRLEAAGSRVLRTDEAGAIELWAKKDGSFFCQTFHERESTDMQKEKDEKQNKSNRFALIASGIVLAAGALTMTFSLLSPGKGTDPAGSSAGSGEPSAAMSLSLREEGETGTTSGWADSTANASAWPITTPAGKEEESSPPEPTLSPRPLERNGGRGGPDRDPQAEGFWLDTALTDKLYALLAGDLTNNTDEADPFRCISQDFKADLDRIAEAFVAGELSAEEGKAAMKGMSFTWPGDKLQLNHPLGDTVLRCYAFPGRDMELAKERILLSNVTPRHYLFLRVYYNPTQDAVRIYMVNGLIY